MKDQESQITIVCRTGRWSHINMMYGESVRRDVLKPVKYVFLITVFPNSECSVPSG